MSSRTAKFLWGGSLVAVAIGIYLFYSYSTRTLDWRYAFEPGTRYRYRLALKSEDTVNASKGTALAASGMATISSRIDLDAELVLSSYGTYNGNFLLGISLADVRRHEFVYNGAEVMPDEAAFDKALGGQEGWILMRPDGQILSVNFRPEAPVVAKTFLKTIVGELQVQLQSGVPSWKRREVNRRGVGMVGYAVGSRGWGRGATVKKERSNYSSLSYLRSLEAQIEASGGYEAELSPKGYIAAMTGSETVTATNESGAPLYSFRGSVDLSFLGAEEFELSDGFSLVGIIKTTESYGLGQTVHNEQLTRENYFKIAKGLSREEFSRLAEEVNAGRLSGDAALSSLVWRGHGLLGLDPSFAVTIKEVFDQERTSSDLKRLLMTMLTSHSHPQAQQAVRDIIGSDAMRKDRRYLDMLQETAMIEHPETATLDTVRDLMRNGKKGEKYASAYTMGGMVQTLQEEGRTDEARRYNDELVSELRNAQSDEDRQRLLIGLANAGMEENAAVVRDHMHDPNDETRVSAAMALRKTADETSNELLDEMTSDGNEVVRNTALLMLSKRQNDATQLEKVKQRIENGEITEANYFMVLSLLSANIAKYPALVADICRAMLAHGVKNKELDKKIRVLLQSVG